MFSAPRQKSRDAGRPRRPPDRPTAGPKRAVHVGPMRNQIERRENSWFPPVIRIVRNWLSIGDDRRPRVWWTRVCMKWKLDLRVWRRARKTCSAWRIATQAIVSLDKCDSNRLKQFQMPFRDLYALLIFVGQQSCASSHH